MDQALHDVLTAQLDRMYRFAYTRTRDTYRAEELTHNIILAAIRSHHGLRDKERLEAWLWGVARNVYLRSLKGLREIPTGEEFIYDGMITYATPETADGRTGRNPASETRALLSG